MEAVAHRAGNRPATIAPALAIADTIELDVHLLRGRLEVRHSKTIWPFRLYWERGQGLLPDEHPVDLAAILAATPADAHLWIDLKGFTGRLARRVLRAVDRESDRAWDRAVPGETNRDTNRETGGRRPLTMSCRSWWALRPARTAPGVRTFRSVGNRPQLALALRLRHPDGIAVHERFATPEVLDRLRDRCARIAVWGVSDRSRADALDQLGIDALILDDPTLADRDPSGA